MKQIMLNCSLGIERIIFIIISITIISCQEKAKEFDIEGHWCLFIKSDSGELTYQENFFDSTHWIIIQDTSITAFQYDLREDTLFSVYKKPYFPHFKFIHSKCSSIVMQHIPHLDFSSNPPTNIEFHRIKETHALLVDRSNYTFSLIKGFKFKQDSIEEKFWKGFNKRREKYLKRYQEN